MTMSISAATNHVPSPCSIPDGVVTFAFGTTSLGQTLVAATAKGICAVLLGSDRTRLVADLKEHFPEAEPAPDDHLTQVVAHITDLIENPARPLHLELDLQGSDFEIKVWQALRAIPAGETLSYSDLAERIGLKGIPKAAKDVADACAANRIAVAVPCHRIRRKDGTISGNRWGVHRKRALLKREGAQ
jgi:AraC family transcriptional regulator, regulatory protein of adaptative response / methylated-DNA-[protein]-cysteine methyltransferase